MGRGTTDTTCSRCGASMTVVAPYIPPGEPVLCGDCRSGMPAQDAAADGGED